MQTHYYAWKNNEKRATMYKRECHIITRGARNSILIEFADGQRECVSRHSVRRLIAVDGAGRLTSKRTRIVTAPN